MNNLKEVTSPETPSPEVRNGIAHQLRLHLLELCQENSLWFANGHGYLKKIGDDWFFMDSRTGQEMIIVLDGQELHMQMVISSEKNAHLKNHGNVGNIHFRLVTQSGEPADKLHHAINLDLISTAELLSLLSEGSMRIAKIDDMRRRAHFKIHGNNGPAEEILFGPRKNSHNKLLHPYTIPLETKEGYRFSYGEGPNDMTFIEEESGLKWYPDLLTIGQGNIKHRYGREFIEMNCVYLTEGKKPNQQKSFLFSRINANKKFTPHYLTFGERTIRVSHLVNEKEAEIIFDNKRWIVQLGDDGELRKKHNRYFQVSQPKTFWYDIQTGERLDHEPV